MKQFKRRAKIAYAEKINEGWFGKVSFNPVTGKVDVQVFLFNKTVSVPGQANGKIGDWLVTYESGRRSIWKDEAFQKEFEPYESKDLSVEDLEAVREKALNELMAMYRVLDEEMRFHVDKDCVQLSSHLAMEGEEAWRLIEIINAVSGPFVVDRGVPSSVLVFTFPNGYDLSGFAKKYSVDASQWRNGVAWQVKL